MRTPMYGPEYRYVRERAGYTRIQICERAEEMQGLLRTQQGLAKLEGGDEPMPERWVEILRLTIGQEVFDTLRHEWSTSVCDVADEEEPPARAVDRHDADDSDLSAMSHSEAVVTRKQKNRRSAAPNLGSDGSPEQHTPIVEEQENE